MNRIAAIACALLPILSGCYTEKPYLTERTISLNLGGPGTPLLQEALKTVEAVATSHGFVLDKARNSEQEKGLLAGYVRYDSNGIRLVGTLDVRLVGRQLEAVFIELGNRTGRLSPGTEAVLASLQLELTNRYGSAAVSIK